MYIYIHIKYAYTYLYIKYAYMYLYIKYAYMYIYIYIYILSFAHLKGCQFRVEGVNKS